MQCFFIIILYWDFNLKLSNIYKRFDLILCYICCPAWKSQGTYTTLLKRILGYNYFSCIWFGPLKILPKNSLNDLCSFFCGKNDKITMYFFISCQENILKVTKDYFFCFKRRFWASVFHLRTIEKNIAIWASKMLLRFHQIWGSALL